jgi:hypothetical protein
MTNNAACMRYNKDINFLKGSDTRMESAGRNVILYMEKCPAHPPNKHPGNCTRTLQPLHLGIINWVEVKSRKVLVQRTIPAKKKQGLKFSISWQQHGIQSILTSYFLQS